MLVLVSVLACLNSQPSGSWDPRCRFPSRGNRNSVFFCGQIAWLTVVSCLAPVTGHPSPWDRSYHRHHLKAWHVPSSGWAGHIMSVHHKHIVTDLNITASKVVLSSNPSAPNHRVQFCVAHGETVTASVANPELRGQACCFLQGSSPLPPCHLHNYCACLGLFSSLTSCQEVR